MESKDPKTYKIIGAAMEVHKNLGSGFFEAVYQEALAIEMEERRIPFQSEVEISVFYKEYELKQFYRADFICYDSVIVELKAIKKLTEIEEAQLLNYMKAADIEIGLLLNFGSTSLEYKRFINTRKSDKSVKSVDSE